MLRVDNNLNKMANLMFAFRYFEFYGLLAVVYNHLGAFFFLAQEIIALLTNIDYIPVIDNVIQLTFQGC